jgi:hypothetical protein
MGVGPQPTQAYEVLRTVIGECFDPAPRGLKPIYTDENVAGPTILKAGAHNGPGYRPDVLPAPLTMVPKIHDPDELYLLWTVSLNSSAYGIPPIHKMVGRAVQMFNESRTVQSLLSPMVPTTADFARAIYANVAMRAREEWNSIGLRTAIAQSLSKYGAHVIAAPDHIQALGVDDIILTALSQDAARVTYLWGQRASPAVATKLLQEQYVHSDAIIGCADLTEDGKHYASHITQTWRDGRWDQMQAVINADNKARFEF